MGEGKGETLGWLSPAGSSSNTRIDERPIKMGLIAAVTHLRDSSVTAAVWWIRGAGGCHYCVLSVFVDIIYQRLCITVVVMLSYHDNYRCL